MQLTRIITAAFALGASAAPSPGVDTQSSTDIVARGGSGYKNYYDCGEGGYYYSNRCYCHSRNYFWNDGSCSYYCHDDSWYDYDNECCSCYNDYDYSDEHGCSGGY